MKPGEQVPALVAVVARNVVDGMRIWGQVDAGEIRLNFYPFAAVSMAVASAVTPGVVRVEARSEVDGDTFLLYADEDLIMVERGPKVGDAFGPL